MADSGEMWSSADGAAWSPAPSRAEWAERFRPTLIVFDGRLWIVGGLDRHDVWHSEDGLRWNREATDAAWFPRGGVSENSNPEDVWCIRRVEAR